MSRIFYAAVLCLTLPATASFGSPWCLPNMAQFVSRFTTTGYRPFMARMGASQYETIYNWISALAAQAEFNRAVKNVPEYAKFVAANGPMPTTWGQVPITNKANYIKPSQQNNPLGIYVGSTIPPGSIRDTSTGTSGIPTAWYRGPKEVTAAQQVIGFRSRAILGDGPYYFVNGFALGPWATGVTVARGVGADQKAITSNIGPNPAEMLKAIKEAARLFPTRPIIVAGYPPHMQELVELANQEGFPLHDHNVLALVGGEGMSETQRDLITAQRTEDGKVTRTGVGKVYSFYGASDLDINIAFETDFEVALRKALMKNPALAKSLFGSHPFVPMVFHYDPLANFIETDPNGNLLFTNVEGNRISPRIRYDLGDKGQIMKMSEVQAKLKELGIDLGVTPRTNLPMLFVWGRIDSYITYRGANVSPENLDEALQKTGLSPIVRNYGFRQYEENGTTQTEMMIELAEGKELPKSDAAVLHALLDEMRKVNIDLSEQMRAAGPDAQPRLRVFTSDSPMAKHRRDNPSHKRKYIFLGSDIQDIDAFDGGGRPVTAGGNP